MGPKTSRDFPKAASQRLDTAEFLLRYKYTLDATYIAGYVVECSLKALILAITPEPDRQKTLVQITAGAPMHNPEVLLGILRRLGIHLPADLARKLRRSQSTWSTNLRYETGRKDTSETQAFCRTAKLIYNWVEAQLP